MNIALEQTEEYANGQVSKISFTYASSLIQDKCGCSP